MNPKMSTHTKNTTPPEGYREIRPMVDTRDGCSIVLTSEGIVRITNRIERNFAKQSFYETHIFYSAETKRYLVKSKYRLMYNLAEIREVKTKSRNKLSYPEAVAVLDLDPKGFVFEKDTIEPKNPNQKMFLSQRTYEKLWDCLNYFVVG